MVNRRIKALFLGNLLVFVGLASAIQATPALARSEWFDLGTLGGTWSKAVAVSADGNVVVGSSPDAAGNTRSFRWTENTGIADLGSMSGLSPEVYAVSADGSVVVGTAKDAAGEVCAFRWTEAGGMVCLAGLPGYSPYPQAVSADGNVIVGMICKDNLCTSEVI
jgi:probable HAF family extracellular repeat protein